LARFAAVCRGKTSPVRLASRKYVQRYRPRHVTAALSRLKKNCFSGPAAFAKLFDGTSLRRSVSPRSPSTSVRRLKPASSLVRQFRVVLCLQHLGSLLLIQATVLVLRFGMRFATFSNVLGSSRCQRPSQAGPGNTCRVPLTPGVFFRPFRATTFTVAA